MEYLNNLINKFDIIHIYRTHIQQLGTHCSQTRKEHT